MKRFFLDIGVLILLLLVMGFHFLPQILHEAGGLILMAAVVLHLVLNRAWFGMLLHGKWSSLRILQTIAALLLSAVFLIAIVTGIVISNHVFRELWMDGSLHRSVFVHQLHIASAYMMIILGGMHIGMHGKVLWDRLKKIFPALDIIEAHSHLQSWGLILVFWAGCAFSHLDQVGDRLLMTHIFGSMASRLPAAVYFLLLLCLMGAYGILFYYVQRYLQQRELKRLEGTAK